MTTPKNFDNASHLYDTTFTFSKIGRAQRKMVYKYLKPIINQKKKLSVLELNCGTGEDAIYFSELGHDVEATDISKGMIEVAKEKSYPENLKFSVQDITLINEQSFDKKFDLIFSNFGGLNCLSKDQLKSFFETAKDLLNSNGKIVIIIMPRYCLWERLYFTLKGNFKKAKRRKAKDSVIANVVGSEIKTWYYNPEEILSLTEEEYSKENIKPIGLVIPPSYLENSFLTKRLFLSILKRIDKVITGSFWAKYADHFLIELKKK